MKHKTIFYFSLYMPSGIIIKVPYETLIFFYHSYPTDHRKWPIGSPADIYHSILSYQSIVISSVSKQNCRQKPTQLTPILTQIMYDFNGRTVQPLEAAAPPGYRNSTSRSQTSSSIRTLKRDYAVIPVVTFIRCSLANPHLTNGSL